MAHETRRNRPPVLTLAFTLLLCLSECLADEKCTTGFTVVAPEVAVPGKTTVVLVTLHDATAAPVNVSLRLESQPNDGKDVRVLVAESRMIVGHGIIPLSIPQVPAGSCTLHTSVGCGDDDCSMRSHAAVRLLGPVRDVIVRPARHTYRPGETITFWVLALDHDLRLARDVLGSVTLQDPAGTKVSIWEQVSLDEGVKKFTIPLSARAAAGSWLLSATAAGGTGAAPLTVSAAGGAGAGRERAAGERHEVELRFAGGRRWYKPGLRFEGRVEAESTEKSVRVRVKLFDGSIAIYSQDIEMAQGDGSFTVPTVLADNDVIYLQAELVSVEGKEIESHYVLAREPIHKWNSTSQCYLMISGLHGPFQPASTASVSIASTCECGRSALLLAVTTAGRATHWAAPAYQHATEPGTPLCTYNYSFTILAEMAPVSQLLAYYLTEDGESVSDVSSFEVRLLHKEVAVVLEERRFWYPRQPVNMRILAEPGATVCLIGGRSATDDKFEPHVSEEPTPAAGELGLVWAGVSLSQRRCGARGGALLYRRRRAATARAALLGGEPADRLWMWKCFNYSTLFATDGLTISAPAEAGAWTVWALSLSARGLRFSPARHLAVFRPIQLDFRSPPVLKVGETVEVDIRIGNNINSCMDVSALLSLSAGAQFLSNGMMYVTERLRLGPGGATSLVVKVTVTTTGSKNMSVEVTGYSADNCDESYLSFRNETLVGSVVRSATIFVQPEGLLKTDTESAYFCANEHLLLSTRSQFVYEWVPSPRNRAGLVFEVRSGGPVHVALSEERDITDSMYHLVINSEGKTWIGRGKHVNGVHLTSIETQLTLSDDSFTTYWLSWDLNTLSFGRGPVIHNGTVIQWKTDRSSHAHYIGFASGWGKVAEFRIWNFNDEAGFSQVLELSLPKGVVPGSAQGSLLVAGGLVLPHIELDALSAMSSLVSTGAARVASFPTSLAAAAASFAPLLALEHTPHLVNFTHHENIVKSLPGQIQTLLSFRKTDNSFSDHSSLSSHSSTIQILEILSKTQAYFPVDPELLQSVKRWVQARQEIDGSFSPLPADIKILYSKSNEVRGHGKKKNSPGYGKLEYVVYEKNNTKKHQEILERDIEMTAETLATLLEIGIENEMDSNAVLKARSYLEKHLYNVTSSYPLASLVYSLVLSRSPMLPDALDVLKNASTTEEGEFGWPHPLPRRDAADWLYEEDSNRNIKLPVLKNLEDYKASLNVLLIHSLLGDLRSAEPVARYLYYRASTLEQHPELIYTAVKAFSQFGALAYDRHRSLTVSLATAGMELTDTVELNAKTLPRLLQLPGLPTKVFVYATGAGCATVQGTITYSTYTPNAENGLLSLRSAVIEEIRPERSSIEDLQGNLPTLNIKTCFRWKNVQRSGVLRLEISLFSGYELSSINPVVIDGGNFADLQHGSKADFIWFVLANISNACPVCITYQVRSNFIISSLRPAYTKIYPVTRPDLAAESFFHTRSGSPLLRGITDDDFITWFGKTESANNNESLDNICECGRICRNTQNEISSTSTQKPVAILQTEKVTEQNIIKVKMERHSQEMAEKLNKQNTATRNEGNVKKTLLKNEQLTENVTQKTVNVGIPIIYPTATVTNSSSHNVTISNALIPTVTSVLGHADELVIQKIMYKKLDRETEKIEKSTKKKNLPRRKGTLQATYGDKAIYVKRNITIREMPLRYTMSTESSNLNVTLNNKSTTSQTKLDLITSTHRVEIEKNFSTTTIIPSTEGIKAETLSNSRDSTSTTVTTTTTLLKQPALESQYPTTTISPSKLILQDSPDSVHLITTKRSSLSNSDQLPRLSTISKSINKEIHQIPPTPFSETSKTVTKSIQSKVSPENRDGYVVLDKNELWDILKEVIHVEMDKNSEKLEAESKLNTLKDNVKNTRSL